MRLFTPRDCLEQGIKEGDYILFQGADSIGEPEMMCGEVVSIEWGDVKVQVYPKHLYRVRTLSSYGLRRVLVTNKTTFKKFLKKDL